MPRALALFLIAILSHQKSAQKKIQLTSKEKNLEYISILTKHIASKRLLMDFIPDDLRYIILNILFVSSPYNLIRVRDYIIHDWHIIMFYFKPCQHCWLVDMINRLKNASLCIDMNFKNLKLSGRKNYK